MVDIKTSHSQPDALPPITDETPGREPRHRSPLREIGRQPIVVTAFVLALLVVGIGSIFTWRAYSGGTPEPERLTASRLQQARVAQASEQIIEKTKGIETTQQQSIDQLQVVQDQLQTMQRLLTSQQNDTRKLTEQVGNLTSTLDSFRQSFASVSATNDNASVRAPRASRSQVGAHKRGGTKIVAVQRRRSK